MTNDAKLQGTLVGKTGVSSEVGTKTEKLLAGLMKVPALSLVMANWVCHCRRLWFC